MAEVGEAEREAQREAERVERLALSEACLSFCYCVCVWPIGNLRKQSAEGGMEEGSRWGGGDGRGEQVGR